MHGHEDELLFFVSFLASFGFIRTSAHLIKAQVKWWPGNVEVGGTHIHHLVWGILLILICGYIGAVERPDAPWRHIAIIGFGIGTGLTMDEFALWLNLRDVYWEKEGRRSIDAVIVVAILAGLAVTGLRLWVDAAEDVEAEVVTVVGVIGLVRLRVRRRERGQGEVRHGAAQHRDPGDRDRGRRAARATDLAVGPRLLLAGQDRPRRRALRASAASSLDAASRSA